MLYTQAKPSLIIIIEKLYTITKKLYIITRKLGKQLYMQVVRNAYMHVIQLVHIKQQS